MSREVSDRAAPRRSLLRLAAASALAPGLSGCIFPERGPAVPPGQTAEATVLGIPNERFFPALDVGPLEAEYVAAMERHRRALGLPTFAGMPPLQLLAISGGGQKGAFGAGVLCGWTDRGTRPTFGLVTGVSTGALAAPFAFLGSSHDSRLRAVYVDTKPDRILATRNVTAALLDDALADNTPLLETISRHVDDRLLADIAAAYEAGRLLLIASADLDAQMPVIWNIGAIARSGHPKAVATVRRILLAATAIPGAFPPSLIDVTVNGKPYQEMHVDGGVFSQMFLYPPALAANRERRRREGLPTIEARAFLIRNGRLGPEWAQVERRMLSIADRAILTMIDASGYNDVIRIHDNTRRDDVDFNLAFVGRDFSQIQPDGFNPAYMRALYDYGYRRARQGDPWMKQPPAF